MIIDELVNAYEEAEITLLLADLNGQNRCVLVYGVVELRAPDQPRSRPITSGQFPQFQKSIGGGITLYAKRIFIPVVDAVEFFRNPTGFPSDLRGMPIELAGVHQSFPPGEEPLLIEPNR
jgi:hypothetical protein